MTAQEIINRVYVQTDPVNNTWLDITRDVVSKSVRLSKGIPSSDPLRRIADMGQFTFLLRNDAVTGLGHRYTPGHTNCTAGFGVRAKVKLVSTWRGISKTQWAGWIPPDGIEQIVTGPYVRFASVTAYDHAYFWMNNPVTLSTIQSDKNMGEIGLVLMGLITAQPSRIDQTDYVETFENTNDTVVENTTVYNEANKAALSELGHMRVKYEPYSGAEDIVAFEGRQFFDTVPRFNAIPDPAASCPHILSEDGFTIVAEDGSGIVADSSTPFDYLTGVQTYKIINGANYATRWIGKTYPRKVGTTAVIFRLNKAIKLDAGDKRENMRVRYVVADGFKSITARNVSLTSYAMNSLEDGTGDDLTADLTITGTYGSGDAQFDLENTGDVDGYVTTIEISGDPIYIGDTVSQVEEIASGDDTLYGKIEKTLDQKYQSDPTRTLDQITLLATRYGAQRVNTVEYIEFCANLNETLAAVYALTDQSARLPIYVPEYDIREDYYVNGIDAWYDGVFTFCRLYLKPARVETYIFWKIGQPGNSELGSSTRLGIPL